MHTLKPMVIAFGLLALSACGGSGNVSNNGSGGGSIAVTCSGATTGNLNLSGLVTFEKVPHNGSGLDYTAPIPQAAARGVTVQALNGRHLVVLLERCHGHRRHRCGRQLQHECARQQQYQNTGDR